MTWLRPGTPDHLDAPERFSDLVERSKRAVTGFSVRTKILGIVLLLTAVLGAAATWQVQTVLASVLVSEFDQRGQAVAAELASKVAEPLRAGDISVVFDRLVETVEDHVDTEYAVVYDADGRVVTDTFGSEGAPPGLLESLAEDPSASVPHAIEGGRDVFHTFTAPVPTTDEWTIRVGLSGARLNAIVQGTTTQMLITTGFAFVAAVAAASFLTWLLTRPIADLVDTTRRIGRGDTDVRATRWADDEIGDLAVAFNRMVEDLEADRDVIAQSEQARAKLLEQILHAQESERKRISRELHDSIGQSLSSLMVGIVLLGRDGGPGATEKVDELREQVGGLIDQVRGLSRELRPGALDDLGLEAALQRYVQDFQVLHPVMTVDLHVDLPERLASDSETALYRVVQEAMTNAARHSGGLHLSIVIRAKGQTAQAIIEDDGEGLSPRSNGGDEGFGIHSMRERTELLGGRFDVESGSSGTTVYVEVPL